MQTFLDKLCAYYHLDADSYARLTRPVTFASLPAYSQFQGIEIALNRINAAMATNEKIVIYGDYDCDGVCSTAILVQAFKKLGYPVGYYLPSRYLDGYGLTTTMVEQFKEKGYSLIITVDNGVSQIEAITLAKQYGIETIITDHHQIINDLPPALVTLHPTYSHYGEVITCGAYVALMLATGLLGYEEPYLVTLAAVATISDMMLLTSYNRDIVRLGIAYLNKENYLPLVKLMGEGPYDENSIAMALAPKINAIGRMIETREINALIQYFTEVNPPLIDRLYQWIISINDQRKATLKTALSNDDEVDATQPAIIVVTREKEGLIGLLAAQYLNTYGKPSIVFVPSEVDPTLYKGSARSRKGFNLAKAFQSMDDVLVSYGGHSAAGGCSLRQSDLALFRQRFNALAEQFALEEQLAHSLPLNISEITWENYATLRTLAPFGQGHPAPTFHLGPLPTKPLAFSRDGKHLMSPLGANVKLLGFNMPQATILPLGHVSFFGRLNLQTYRGTTTLNFQIDDYRPESAKNA